MGMYPVAIIIFIASFVVPLSKIMGLFTLMYNAKRKTKMTLKQQGKLYHVVEFLGPWSMLDVFVVALLLVSVKLGALAKVEVHYGLYIFTASVIMTMILSFWIYSLAHKKPKQITTE